MLDERYVSTGWRSYECYMTVIGVRWQLYEPYMSVILGLDDSYMNFLYEC